jgi:sulfate transport system ATP-binding protein
MTIRVSGLHKAFGATTVLRDVSLEVGDGELVALLGPSGGGKSTILRVIAGLEQADAGEVWLGGKRVDHLDPQARGVGFVFQHYALFRHMSVAENVAFGLRVRGVDARDRLARAHALLDRVGLGGLGARMPHELSGGQRQRVALARAMAPEPRLLLLDEPFGAVDAKVREELRRWLRHLHDQLHTTSIFVTHDQEEAFAVADRVMIIRDGALEQAGTPSEILDAPATEFVSRFVGDVNTLDGVVEGGALRLAGLSVPAPELREGQAGRLVVRAYDIKLWREEGGPAVVHRLVPLGDRVRVEARLSDGRLLTALFPQRSSLLRGVEPGAPVAVELTRRWIWPAAGPAAHQ